MANFSEDYLQDLLDLEEDIIEEEKNGNHDIDEEENGEAGHEEEGTTTEEFTEKDRAQQKRGTSNLLNDKDFLRHMDKIDKYSQAAEQSEKAGTTYTVDDEEYQLITKTTEYVSVIDREIVNIHKFVRDIYLAKFPELEDLIRNPIEYVNCVKAIQNETDSSLSILRLYCHSIP